MEKKVEQETIPLLEKIKNSTVVKVISGYAVIAFITVQVASLVSDSFGFGEDFMQYKLINWLHKTHIVMRNRGAKAFQFL